jgi:hypothetical protein
MSFITLIRVLSSALISPDKQLFQYAGCELPTNVIQLPFSFLTIRIVVFCFAFYF